MRPKTPFKKSNLPVQNEPAPIWGVFHINIRPRTPSGAFFISLAKISILWYNNKPHTRILLGRDFYGSSLHGHYD